MSTLGSLSPPGEAIDLWGGGSLLVEHCAGLGEGWYHPSVQFFPISEVQGVFPSHPQVLELPQCCLVYGEMLVGLFVKGTEVENDLCHHLHDITPPHLVP